MSDIERRYFWCDGLTPLHAALEYGLAKQTAAIQSINDLAKSMGGTGEFAGRDGFVSGFIFDKPPPSGAWKHVGTLEDGSKYYAPTKRSVEGRNLSRRMSMRWYEPISTALVNASGMERDVIQGRYFCHSSAGFKDGRIFISVPAGKAEGGDKFPKIPKYMTECKEWEMQRWFDIGREPK